MKNMSEREGYVEMRFIGKPNGVLMKRAPGNYVHGELYMKSIGKSRLPFWELKDKPPEVIAPPLTVEDDAYMFIPEETQDITMSGSDVMSNEAISRSDPNAPAILEPYASFNTGTGELTDIKFEEQSNIEIIKAEPVEEKLELTRDELLAVLKKAGVEVKPRTRTTTLLKMVDELDSEEDA